MSLNLNGIKKSLKNLFGEQRTLNFLFDETRTQHIREYQDNLSKVTSVISKIEKFLKQLEKVKKKLEIKINKSRKFAKNQTLLTDLDQKERD